MSAQPEHVPNHQFNPLTGFIENNGFLQAFDSNKKAAFIAQFKRNQLRLHRTCRDLGVKYDTFAKHYDNDPAFKAAVEQAKTEYYDDLEGLSRQNAMNPRSVIERIFQLKAAFPEKYGEGKRDFGVSVTLNVDGKTLDAIRKREQILEAEVIPSTPSLSTDTDGLSANNKEESSGTDRSG